MRELVLLFFTLNFVWGCNEQKPDGLSEARVSRKDFSDPAIRQLYDLTDRRASGELIPFFKSTNAEYRQLAAQAFGTIKDKTVVPSLEELLYDKVEAVQKSAAFAIGQIGEASSEEPLIAAYLKANSKGVRAAILEAVGRSGSARGVGFLVSQIRERPADSKAALWGMVRFAGREVWTDDATATILKVLYAQERSPEERYLASLCMRQLTKVELTSEQVLQMITLFKHAEEEQTRENLIYLLGQNVNIEQLGFVESVFKSASPSVVVSLLNSLNATLSKPLFSVVEPLLMSSNRHVAIAASEYFVRRASSKDSRRFLSMATPDKNWRVAANLFRAALKASPSSQQVFEAIKSRYETSTHVYEKAFLIRALGESVSCYKYLAKVTFNTKESVVAAYGMEALVHLRSLPDFELQNDKSKSKGGVDLKQEFALIMKQAITSNETPLIALAANTIRRPEYGYINAFENTYFLTQALHRLEMPRQVEAYNALFKTIVYFNGVLAERYKPPTHEPINWSALKHIQQDFKVQVVTNKGEFVLALKPNQAPSTVANFVTLVKGEFYDQKPIHNVVSTSFIETGSTQGDGWGVGERIIRSELSDITYKRGTVGMVSTGLDTESTQWFIACTNKPSLDGKYTAFAEVDSGMDVIDRLEIGDKITTIKLITEE